ncbi:MAG: AAA family ATPase [Rickettsiaceae bacterium]|nr:AAA family ATPase [Rickettsiaceae bacterium]
MSSSIDMRFSRVGSDDFEKIVTTEGAILVDKTLFIKEVLTAGDVSLITRPRRWGKTLNMSMLQYFFSIPVKRDGSVDEERLAQKKAIFARMQIGQQYPEIVEQYCGKYPTIFVTFKGVDTTSHKEVLEGVSSVIYDAFAAHEYMLSSDKLGPSLMNILERVAPKQLNDEEIKKGLQKLSEMLFNYFGKNAIILIDEYDSPMNGWYSLKLSGKKVGDDPEDILKLFRSVFGHALKTNTHMERSVVTGILRIAKSNLFSGINNLTEASILDKRYASHFGFTEEEVKGLLHDCDMDHDDSAINEIKSWYNGYNIGGITIYNPWSIINYLRERELRAYWVGTGSTALLEIAGLLDDFQPEMQHLIEGGRINMTADPHMVFSEIRTSHEAFYNLLLFSGYLTPQTVNHNTESDVYSCEVRIPNREVRSIFLSFLRKWISKKFEVEELEYTNFIRGLLAGDVETFISKLRKYLEVSASYHSTGDAKKAEIFYNGLVLGLIATISYSYFVETERESGTGRVDLLLIPKANTRERTAFVIEFKALKDAGGDLKARADEALAQIKSKNYASKITAYENIERTISLGLAFCGKDVEASWE